MPVFFLCFIVFIIWLHVKTKQENANKPTWDRAFWEKERQSNFARKQNIDDLDYIRPDASRLPFSETATGYEKEYQEQVREMLSKKMLNLSGLSNADVKLTYGAANFQVLSGYDQTFSVFLRNLNIWARYLHTQMTGEDDRVAQILEYAVSLGSDIMETYVMLAQIYLQRDQIEKVQHLIEQVEASDFFMRDSIINHLQQQIRNYQ